MPRFLILHAGFLGPKVLPRPGASPAPSDYDHVECWAAPRGEDTDRRLAGIELLVVCTANQCRSPVAAAFLRERLPARWSVSSAGFLAGGSPMPPDGVKLMAKRGIDLSGHRSRQLDGGVVGRADVVLAMERRHVRELVALRPDALERSYALKDFVRLTAGKWPRWADWAGWLADLSSARTEGELLGRGGDADVRDPVGASARVWKSVIGELDKLTGQAATVLG